jgi:hypothetical protein
MAGTVGGGQQPSTTPATSCSSRCTMGR